MSVRSIRGHKAVSSGFIGRRGLLQAEAAESKLDQGTKGETLKGTLGVI